MSSDHHPGPIEGQETERHVLLCAMVVEVPKGTNIDGLEGSDVIPNLACWVDGVFVDEIAREGDGSLFYLVRDVTLYSEAGFKAELAEHGPDIANFPDVYMGGRGEWHATWDKEG